MRLDDFVLCNSVIFPECIKLDVDGHELEVLIGAESTLADPRCKSIIFENDETDPVTPQIRAFLEEKGFTLRGKNHHQGSNEIYDLVYVKR